MKLGELTKSISRKNRAGQCGAVYSVTNSQGFVPSTEYFSKEVFSESLASYKLVERNQIAYNPSRINVGSVALQDKEDKVIVSPLYVVFSVDSSRLEPAYLLRFLKSAPGLSQIEFLSVGTVRNNLKYDGLSKILLKVPALEEQRSRLRALTALEERIRISRNAVANLDALVKSQFVAMFGDFETGYKYHMRKLGELLSTMPQNGLYKPQSCYVAGGGVPIVRVDTFQSGFIEDYRKLKRLSCTNKEIASYGLHENDIVINRVNGSIERVGKIARIQGLLEPTVFESNMMRFHVDEGALDLAYATSFLNSPDIRAQIKACARIANQCSINQSNVMGFDIPLPPLALQQEFASFVAQVDKSRFDGLKEGCLQAETASSL